jgi:hypothetical protein
MQPVPQDPGLAADVPCSVSLPHICASEPAMSHSRFSFRVRHKESIYREKQQSLPPVMYTSC